MSSPPLEVAGVACGPGPGSLARERILVSIALVLGVVLAFGASIGFEFVDWDDPLYVTTNSHVLPGLTLDGVRWAWTTRYAANWHPLAWISHMADVSLFGLSPAGHHATNLALHAGAAVLLFLFFVRATGATGRSAALAGFFALHPLRAESVVWVSERKDVLCAFFFAATLVAWERYARRPGTLRYLFAVALAGLALASKPMAVTLPLVLLLVDVWPLERWKRRTDADTSAREHRQRPLSLLLIELVPFAIGAGITALLTMSAQHEGGATANGSFVAIGERFANAVVSIVRYVWMTFVPGPGSALYPHPDMPGGEPWSAAVVAGAVGFSVLATAGAFVAARRRPYLCVGWFWFLTMLLPVLGLVQVGTQAIAERYTYLPHIGLIAAIVWGTAGVFATWFHSSPSRSRQRLRPLGLATLLLLLLSTVAAARRASMWRDSTSLFTRTLATTPRNPIALGQLGLSLLREGDAAGAERALRRALELRPVYPEARLSLAEARAAQGDHAGAVAEARAALAIWPDFAAAESTLGRELGATGAAAEGVAHLRRAVELAPERPASRFELGLALDARGDLDGAAVAYGDAARLDPYWPDAWNNEGLMRLRQGRLEEAEQLFREALRRKPGFFDALVNLGNRFEIGGDLFAAADEYRRALVAAPSSAIVHRHLASVAVRLGRRDEAREELEIAKRLEPGNPELAELAAAIERMR